MPIRTIEVQNELGGLVLQVESKEPINGEHWFRIHVPEKLVPQLIQDLEMCYAIGQSEEGHAYAQALEDQQHKTKEGSP